jgi:hypothetical protein
MNPMISLPADSDIEKCEDLGDGYVSQVRSFGALGYAPDRIAALLNLNKKQKFALSIRLTLPGDVYYEAYRNGQAIGAYNIDIELVKLAEKGDSDSIELLDQRRNDRALLDLRKDLFGI